MSPPAHSKSAAAPLALALRADSAAWRAHWPFVRRHLRAAHAMVRPALVELSVAFVGDKRMGELHDQFMGIPGPTDVLTFPLEQDARDRVTEGEIIVCVPEARRRAKHHGVPMEHELLLYALHGLLHLCGYDDRTQRAYVTMHRKEDEILSRLGVGPVFAPKATPVEERRAARRKRPTANPAARRAR